MIVRARPTRFGAPPIYYNPGMGDVSPVGYPDYESFQSAVVSSVPSCANPIDPGCNTARNAAIQAQLNNWVSNPQSCHNVVCNAAGQPAVGVGPTGQIGYATTTGFVPTTPTAPAPMPQGYVPTYNTGLSPVVSFTSPIATRSGVRTPRYPTRTYQGSSAATAPGGAASTAVTTPIQTQTPPATDGTTTTTSVTVLPSSCTSTQTYISPGNPFTAGPYAGQITSTGACQDNPVSTPADWLSSIPIWAWAIAGIGVVVIATSGGKR